MNELTEKYYNKTLPAGFYYVSNGKKEEIAYFDGKLFFERASSIPQYLNDTAEVIAELPTLKDLSKMQKLLKASADALEVYIPLFAMLKNEKAVETASKLKNKIDEIFNKGVTNEKK